MLTDFYNIWHTCTVLIFNVSYRFTELHLCTAATLPWETCQVHNGNFQSYQHITVAVLKTHPVRLYNQFEFFKVQLLQQMFKTSCLFIHTGLKSLPSFVNSIAHSAPTSYSMCRSSAISDSHVPATHDPASCPIFHSQTGLRRPEVRRNGFQSITMNELNHLMHTVCQHTVLPNTTINVSQSSVAAVCR